MKPKKTKKADLKNKQGLFLQVGMLTALALVFAAFQWSVSEKPISDIAAISIDDYEFDQIPITRMKEKEQKIEPPKVQAEKLEIIEDHSGIDDDDIFIPDYAEDIAVDIIPIDDEPDEKEPDTFIIVEEMPEFPGGERALLKFLAQNTNYPEIAKENGIQGRVFVSFIINKKGKVEKVQLARGFDPLLDKEALRVVALLPNWKPGKQRGKAVNVAYNVPINFKLN